MSSSVGRRDCFPIFKVKVTVKIHIIKIWLFLLDIFWSKNPFAIKLSFLVHHHKPEYLVKEICLLCSRSRSQLRVQNFNDCTSRQYLLSHWTFCSQTWYGDTSDELECYAKRSAWYFQGEDHSEGSYNRNIVFTLSTELLILLRPTLIRWYIITSQDVAWKDCITVFTVTVTAMVEMFITPISSALLLC